MVLTCDQKLCSSTLVFERWGVSMNWQEFAGANWSLLIDWLSNDVDDSSKSLRSDWYHDWTSNVCHCLSSHQALSRVHCNGSYVVTTQMLGYFEY